MNEFWALVLGSALAVAGGIIGTLFTQWLTNKHEKQKERKEAYTEILKFCNSLRIIESRFWNNEFNMNYLTEILSKTLLYASDTVANEYKKIHDLASKMLEASNNNDNEKLKNLRATLTAHIDVLSAQMKKELKLESKRSKELLSKTIDKKQKEKK